MMTRLYDRIRQRLPLIEMPVLVVDDILSEFDENPTHQWDYTRDFNCLNTPYDRLFIEATSSVTKVSLGIYYTRIGSVDLLGNNNYTLPIETAQTNFMEVYTSFKDQWEKIPLIGFINLTEDGKWAEQKLPAIRTAEAPLDQEKLDSYYAMMRMTIPLLFTALDHWWNTEHYDRREINPVADLSRRNKKKYGVDLCSYYVLEEKS